jgi:hypothetical protein
VDARLLLLAPALCGCADLAEFVTGSCGNQILEQGEDCDTFPDPKYGSGARCGEVAGSCRYICSRGATCPPGWSCGGDGVCRHPSGCFDYQGQRFSVPKFDQAELADFNGDRRDDLLLRRDGEITLMLSDARGTLGVTQALGVPEFRGRLDVADVDLDGRADVIIPAQAPLGDQLTAAALILKGTTSALSPTAHLGRDGNGELMLLPARDPRQARSPLVFRHDPRSDEPTLAAGPWPSQCPDPGSTFEELALQLPEPDSVLTPAGAEGQLEQVDGSTIALVALTRRSSLVVAEEQTDCTLACCFDRLLHRQSIDLPAGTEIAGGGISFGDADADGVTDLLIAVSDSAGGSRQIAIARGDRAQLFGQPEIEPRLSGLAAEIGARCPENVPAILGTIELPALGPQLGLITPAGIYRTADATALAAPADRLAWTAAAVGDFDGDDALDVVVVEASRESCRLPISLRLLLGDGAGGFITTLIQGARASLLASGDFDGDRVTDLAIVGSEAEAELVVLYGGRGRPLNERSLIGRIDRIDGLATTRQPRTTPSAPQRIQDLSIGSPLRTLPGSPSRTIFAPLLLIGGATASLAEDEPLAVISGLPRRAPYAPDPLQSVLETETIVFGRETRWSVINDGRTVARADLRARLPSSAKDFDFACSRIAALVGDAGNAVAAIDKASFQDPLIATTRTFDSCGWLPRNRRPTLLIDWSDGVKSVEVGHRCSTSRGLLAGDLDASGAPDLVTALGSLSADADCAGQSVVVVWDPSRAPATESSELRIVQAGDGHELQAIALLNVDAEPAPELAYFDGRSGVAILDVGPGRTLLRPPAGSRIRPLAVPSLRDREPLSMLAGDVDGDGLPDLLQLRGTLASLHLAIAHDAIGPGGCLTPSEP